MSKKVEKNREFLVFHTSWYDNHFPDFVFNEEENYVFIRKQLLEPNHTVAQTGATYRVINNWDANGLLFDNTKRENGWRKFSFTELVWIECLAELRRIGVPVATLKKLRDNLFIFYPSKGPTFDPSELAFFITRVIQKSDVLLIVDAEGRGNFCLAGDYEASQIIHPLPASYVIVSLNSVYARMRKRPDLARKNDPLFPLSEKELDVLYQIAFEGANEVKLTTKDSKIHKVEYKKNVQNPEDVLAKMREEIRSGKRQRISIEVQDGKVIAMENTEKT
ncbi:MAG: hypothetical protein RIQ41_108 [Candidatus Parcubacteria bacterium]|jgi:hypothetical protein